MKPLDWPRRPDITGGTWEYHPADPGDDAVGLAPTPPTIDAVIDADGEPVPIALLYSPARPTGRPPADEFDEGIEFHGSADANGAAIAALPQLLRAAEDVLIAFDQSELIRRFRSLNALRAAVRAARDVPGYCPACGAMLVPRGADTFCPICSPPEPERSPR